MRYSIRLPIETWASLDVIAPNLATAKDIVRDKANRDIEMFAADTCPRPNAIVSDKAGITFELFEQMRVKIHPKYQETWESMVADWRRANGFRSDLQTPFLDDDYHELTGVQKALRDRFDKKVKELDSLADWDPLANSNPPYNAEFSDDEKNQLVISVLAEAFEVSAEWIEDAVNRGISLGEAIAEKKDFLFRQAIDDFFSRDIDDAS